MFRVKEQLQGGDGAGDGIQIVPHMVRAGEGQPGTAQQGGQVLGFEGLVPRHHQQIEVGLLPVAQKQVFAHMDPQCLVHAPACLYGGHRLMVHPLKRNAQRTKKPVHCHLPWKAPFFHRNVLI